MLLLLQLGHPSCYGAHEPLVDGVPGREAARQVCVGGRQCVDHGRERGRCYTAAAQHSSFGLEEEVSKLRVRLQHKCKRAGITLRKTHNEGAWWRLIS